MFTPAKSTQPAHPLSFSRSFSVYPSFSLWILVGLSVVPSLFLCLALLLSLDLSRSVIPPLFLCLALLLSLDLSRSVCRSVTLSLSSPPSLSGPPRWPSGKASASIAEGPGFESRLRRDFFQGQVIPLTYKLALQWLPCQAPGVIGSALGLVSPVSVYCDWVR